MRMRTISEAITYIKSQDPETAFTQTALRKKIITGEIPSVKIGCKYLVNLDTLESYLNPSLPLKIINTDTNVIRPISEKK